MCPHRSRKKDFFPEVYVDASWRRISDIREGSATARWSRSKPFTQALQKTTLKTYDIEITALRKKLLHFNLGSRKSMCIRSLMCYWLNIPSKEDCTICASAVQLLSAILRNWEQTIKRTHLNIPALETFSTCDFVGEKPHSTLIFPHASSCEVSRRPEKFSASPRGTLQHYYAFSASFVSWTIHVQYANAGRSHFAKLGDRMISSE